MGAGKAMGEHLLSQTYWGVDRCTETWMSGRVPVKSFSDRDDEPESSGDE